MLRGAARRAQLPGGHSSPAGTAPRRPGMAEAAAEAGQGSAQGDAELAAVIGATVPTGFEQTAAEEVQEKLGSASRISRDRGKIYFEVPAQSLPQVRPSPRPAPGPSARRAAVSAVTPAWPCSRWLRRWLSPRWSAPRPGPAAL